MDMACPKRCGASEYTKVNRFIMNTLNKIPFKCKFYPKCSQILPYDQLSAHVANCPEGKMKLCESPDCQNTIKALTNQIE